MTLLDRSEPRDPRIAALAAYVPNGRAAAVLLPHTELAEWSDLLGQLGRLVVYGQDASDIAFDPRTVVFAMPPQMPGAGDWLGHADFAGLSEQFAALCTGLTRWVVLDPAALEAADPGAIAPPGPDCAERAARFLDWMAAAPRVFRQRDAVFPLPSTGWEIEVGDLGRESMCQAPAGEVFVQLDTSGWTGRIGLPSGGAMHVERGIVREAYSIPCAVGRRICEIGFGLNPAIRDERRSWGEKALGTVHLGFGLADHDDLLPPTIHFDVLIDPVKYLNVDLWRCL